jgi:transposase
MGPAAELLSGDLRTTKQTEAAVREPLARAAAAATPLMRYPDPAVATATEQLLNACGDAVVRPLLPVPGWLRGRGGQPEAYCHRQILDAIRYLVDIGIKWRAMPADFPPWDRAYAFFRRWRDHALVKEFHDRPRSGIREREGRDAQPTADVIDSQSVKADAVVGSDSRGFDGGKLINGRKRHVVVDTLGLGLQHGDVGDLQELLPGGGDAVADGRPDVGDDGRDVARVGQVGGPGRCDETGLTDQGLGLTAVVARLAQPGRLVLPAVLAGQGLAHRVGGGLGLTFALRLLPGSRTGGIMAGLLRAGLLPTRERGPPPRWPPARSSTPGRDIAPSHASQSAPDDSS